VTTHPVTDRQRVDTAALATRLAAVERALTDCACDHDIEVEPATPDGTERRLETLEAAVRVLAADAEARRVEGGRIERLHEALDRLGAEPAAGDRATRSETDPEPGSGRPDGTGTRPTDAAGRADTGGAERYGTDGADPAGDGGGAVGTSVTPAGTDGEGGSDEGLDPREWLRRAAGGR
jgi:hypothetical protein